MVLRFKGFTTTKKMFGKVFTKAPSGAFFVLELFFIIYKVKYFLKIVNRIVKNYKIVYF